MAQMNSLKVEEIGSGRQWHIAYPGKVREGEHGEILEHHYQRANKLARSYYTGMMWGMGPCYVIRPRNRKWESITLCVLEQNGVYLGS